MHRDITRQNINKAAVEIKKNQIYYFQEKSQNPIYPRYKLFHYIKFQIKKHKLKITKVNYSPKIAEVQP